MVWGVGCRRRWDRVVAVNAGVRVGMRAAYHNIILSSVVWWTYLFEEVQRQVDVPALALGHLVARTALAVHPLRTRQIHQMQLSSRTNIVSAGWGGLCPTERNTLSYLGHRSDFCFAVCALEGEGKNAV